MVGEAEAVVLRLYACELHVRREDEAVDHVVLRGVALGVIGLVVEAAGRRGRVVGKVPAVGQHAVVECAGRPEIGVLDRVLVQPAGERLVEVAAGDDVVALGVFLFEERFERGGLRGLAFAVVIRLQVVRRSLQELQRISDTYTG